MGSERFHEDFMGSDIASLLARFINTQSYEQWYCMNGTAVVV